MAAVVLVRHGETAWSLTGQHTGRTDIPLTPAGREQARALGTSLARWSFVAVFTSPLQRAAETAQLAGLAGAVVDPDLAEWDYGDDEGRTTADIRVDRPGWTVWDVGPQHGESIDDLTARVDRAVERARAEHARGDVAVVGHGHNLRVFGARWLGLTGRDGRRFALDPASISLLGYEREQPVFRSWNLT